MCIAEHEILWIFDINWGSKMTDPFFLNEASKLPLNEILKRLETLYEDGAMSDIERGIYRQIKEKGLSSLSEKQRWHFDNGMIPQCVERCSIKGCTNPTYPGEAYCDIHSVEYGDD
ncbi:Uncharacterised protein [Klebsiella pneumoniae]|nr:hypothetical protein A9G50_08155 [Klebsiella quasipneumoniae subsp. similipneumoniae]OON34773.1 hypothetical protein BU230_32650 [Klebsiella pneumoniae]PXH68142.1 hypothetical protein DMQ73_22445 [Klebsiella pneumoniae]SLX22120.1 Uncharacterised protein [Klebsiella pneumoniae]SLZ90949.1 Uncharacterised protein [Klebsiella pneumoniae]